jgi:KaiC/GvpD/RAD55 family RecA-like ATPase
MNEQSIRKQYALYGHEGFLSRVGALDCKTKDYKEIYLSEIGEILEFCRNSDGKRNLFISRAAINSDKSFRPSWVSTFDLDPIREAGVASTDEQHDSAIQAGYRILQRFPGGSLASSGNGVLLIYRWDNPISDLDYYKKEGIFIEQVLQPLVNEFNVKVDKTNYEKAITKIIGTISTKGDSKYQRLSRFITYANGGSSGISLYDEIRQIPINSMESSTEKFNGNPVKRLQEAQNCLQKLGKEYYDDYEKWSRVGMSLREFGIAGLSLWRDWSKKGETYKEGECEKKWETLAETPEITLGSLKYWASSSEKPISGSSISLSNGNYFNSLFCEDSEFEKPILTGISGLDTCLRGLPKGEITTIAARSGFGKSSFACTVSENLRAYGKRVLYFSTEMSYEYIMHKLVSITTGISTQVLVSKSLSELERSRIKEYEQELLRKPIIICDEFSPRIELVKDLVNREKPDILVFDHATQSGTHWEYIAQFVRGLKELTAEYGMVTLLASQLNEPPRGSNGVVGTSLRGDIRGSQEIIFLSAIFLMMNNIYEVKGDVQPVELEICKNRYGISGLKVELHVQKSTGKFTD